MRLIDADALKQRMGEEHFRGYGNAIILVMDAPTVDAAPVVHGRWKAHKPDCRGYAAGFICSCCGSIVYAGYSMKECEYNYCPQCGAKMDGGADDA